MLEFENYHCHSMYSNCLTQPDSTMRIEDYAKVYRERGMHTLCISEHGNRSNVWQQAEMAAKYSDDTFHMTPIAAAECYFVPVRDPALKDDRNFHLILIARDNEGLRQLNRILSEANMTGFYRKARVDFELLSSLDWRHFLCTTACVAGPVRDDKAHELCARLKNIFHEHFFLEVQHHPQQIQKEHNAKILTLYRQLHVPLIYATDSHYIRHEDAQLRKELLLSSGIRNAYEDDFDLFLPTAQEAYAMLQSQGVLSRAQIEEAMENTLILREFEGVSFTTEKKIPNSRPSLTLSERNYLYKKEVCDGYIAKAGMPSKEEGAQMHAEMDAVADTGTADYFIAVRDVVQKGLEYGGVLTTTGRGSGVSFATNYALGFTSLNRLKSPIRLYPERFISKDRLASGSLPDLDLNCANVPAFVKAAKEVLGEWGCAPMIAFGSNKTLSAFKLLARARNIDFDTSNEISKQLQRYELDLKHAKENAQDDGDYNPEDDVRLEDYVDSKYLQLIAESAQYRGITTSLSPHPCAHLLLDRDIREEIGVIRVKSKSGSKEPVYAAYIDGTTADAYGYLKLDLLRVDVVKIIASTFEACGLPVMTVDELLEEVKHDQRVWDLYANGYTVGLNQVERAKTTQRVMKYKPRNVVELAAFVAAVRPGFKSMLDTFVNRQPFAYGIPSLDKLLQTKEIPSSFLMYDEQVLSVLQAAGIPAPDAYACTKAIKKKKADKVKAYKERFIAGFMAKLQRDEGASEKEAERVADKVWTIIEDASSYMFCAAHALSMACDSLYVAWLKVHHPYELYVSMLKLYTENGHIEKVAAIIDEMRRYMGVTMQAGQYGQNNCDWLADKEHKVISQSLSAVKFISANVPKQLLELSSRHQETFADVLRDVMMDTPINARQMDVLIELGYFKKYGGIRKLKKIAEAFRNGPNKMTKTLVKATQERRMDALRHMEKELPDEDASIAERVAAEQAYIGLCLSFDPNADRNSYLVLNVDDRYGVKLLVYRYATGGQGVLRINKTLFNKLKPEAGDVLVSVKVNPVYKKVMRDGVLAAADTADWWIDGCRVIKKEHIA